MFTGIVTAIGELSVKKRASDAMTIGIDSKDFDLTDVALGDSIAVSGVCLTVISLNGYQFDADVSLETLSKTSLATKIEGGLVNLEKAMKADSRFGGHIVTGHVDGLGEVESLEEVGDYIKFTVKVPQPLSRYFAVKGSVCVDGVSLTINTVSENNFTFMTIPHTLSMTTLGNLSRGSAVNLEIDIIARYLERLIGERFGELGVV
tara:strand:+ start:449 stop:1063 length:615 start_codon:yes stop_codon:yes gene_type:complete